MKLLVAASAIDLDFRYGCTPAWWQLWKGLYEEGADLVVTPYRGRPVESPWWRTAPNPTYVEGESFARARDVVARIKGDTYLRRAEDNPEDGFGERMTREAVWRWVTPRWQKHLDRLVERERPDALLVFTVPMSHLRGVPTYLREKHGIPVVFYDGDAPMSLPEKAFEPYADMKERANTVNELADAAMLFFRQPRQTRAATAHWRPAATCIYRAPAAMPASGRACIWD